MEFASASDVELVMRVRAGQVEAFAAMVERYESLVRAVSYSTTGSRDLCDDIAQETFLAAWRTISSVNDATKLRAWLCGIARNLGLQVLRRTGRESELDDNAPVETAPSALDVMSERESEAAVWRALEAVPEKYRVPLVLHYKEGLDVGAIAETMGLSRVAVQQRLSRGRRSLKGGISSLVEKTLSRGKPAAAGLVTAVVGTIAASTPCDAQASPSFTETTAAGENALWGRREWTMTTKILLVTMLGAVTATTALGVARSSRNDDDETSNASLSNASLPRTPPAVEHSDDPALSTRGGWRGGPKRGDADESPSVAGLDPTATLSQVSISLEHVRGTKLEAILAPRFGDLLGLVEHCFDALGKRQPDLRASDIAIDVDVVWKNHEGLGGIVVSSDVTGGRGLGPDEEFDACVQESTFALDLGVDLPASATATVVVRQNDLADIAMRYLARRLSPSNIERCTGGTGLAGPAIASLDVDGGGVVVRADILGIDRDDARRCLVDTIQSIVFPRPRGPNGQLRIRYPLPR